MAKNWENLAYSYMTVHIVSSTFLLFLLQEIASEIVKKIMVRLGLVNIPWFIDIPMIFKNYSQKSQMIYIDDLFYTNVFQKIVF